MLVALPKLKATHINAICVRVFVFIQKSLAVGPSDCAIASNVGCQCDAV
jgi:hypothetical protein